MIIEILLAAILACELLRLYFSYRNTSKKRHFKNRLAASMQMKWDLEFKIEKTKQIRESFRKEYDAAKSRLFAIDESFKESEKSGAPIPPDQKKEMEENKVALERDIPRLEAVILQLDGEIKGLAPSEGNPEGLAGSESQIDQLRELHKMLQEYIDTL